MTFALYIFEKEDEVVSVKVYTLVCEYMLSDGIARVELAEMLKRLGIKPKTLTHEGIEYGVDYRIEEVVKYNVQKGYRVRYTYERKQKDIVGHFDYDKLSNNLLYLIEHMTSEHDILLLHMPDDRFEEIYRNYGNNYTNQIKRRKR